MAALRVSGLVWRTTTPSWQFWAHVTPSFKASKSESSRNSGTSAIVVSLTMEKSPPAMKTLMTPSFLRSPKDFCPVPDEPYPPLPSFGLRKLERLNRKARRIHC